MVAPSHYRLLSYKVPGGHGTQAMVLICEMIDSGTGRGVVCQQPRVNVVVKEKRPRDHVSGCNVGVNARLNRQPFQTV